MSSNPLCVRKSNTLYKEISFGTINDETLIIIIIILIYIIYIGNNRVTSRLNKKLLKNKDINLLCLGLSERKGLDNNSSIPTFLSQNQILYYFQKKSYHFYFHFQNQIQILYQTQILMFSVI